MVEKPLCHSQVEVQSHRVSSLNTLPAPQPRRPGQGCRQAKRARALSLAAVGPCCGRFRTTLELVA